MFHKKKENLHEFQGPWLNQTPGKMPGEGLDFTP